MKEKDLTVAELIAQLKELPGELPVFCLRENDALFVAEVAPAEMRRFSVVEFEQKMRFDDTGRFRSVTGPILALDETGKMESNENDWKKETVGKRRDAVVIW